MVETIEPHASKSPTRGVYACQATRGPAKKENEKKHLHFNFLATRTRLKSLQDSLDMFAVDTGWIGCCVVGSH
ncbi:MAG TPA: hypothetical protein VGO47_02775 [Chlamydiales bacterium]|jgi:hypothetical protein|nr:hypothetical protein [Chlamydiales bacterium]